MRIPTFMRAVRCVRPRFCLKDVMLVMLFLLLTAPVSLAQNSGDARDGKALFVNNCAVCHGEDASGKTEIAKSLNVTIPDFRSADVHSLTDGQIKNVITQGKGNMPPVSDLSPQDIANLIAFIRTFPAQQSEAKVPLGSAVRGEALFAGRVPFQHGGPACAACHSIAGLPFPNGGTLGPNLTHEYKKLGPAGVNSALETLYFPTMVPLYDLHPLTVSEQADLKAFLESAGSQVPSRDITLLAASICVVGCGVFMLITWAVWRDRLRSVRARLVSKALRRGEISA
jgi:mono/diheme cytochrome c family protein